MVLVLGQGETAGGGGGGPAFTASTVPGLAFWVDASDNASYTLSGSTLTGITNKATSTACTFGGSMGVSTDSQFNGRPSFTAVNSTSTVYFNTGSNISGNWSVYAVMQCSTAIGGGNARMVAFSNGLNQQDFDAGPNGIIPACFGLSSGLISSYTTVNVNQFTRGANHFIYKVAHISGTSMTGTIFRQDGTTNTSNIGSSTFGGGWILVGSTATGGNTIAGMRWAEVLLYKSTVSGPDDATIITYLKSKYAIP